MCNLCDKLKGRTIDSNKDIPLNHLLNRVKNRLGDVHQESTSKEDQAVTQTK